MTYIRQLIAVAAAAALGSSVWAQATRPLAAGGAAPDPGVSNALDEIRGHRQEMEAYSTRMKRLDELIKGYEQRYQQGLTDKANELVDEIIASCPSSSPPFADGGEAYLGQSGYGVMSEFANRLLQRGQNQQAIRVITAIPSARPAESMRLYPPETATAEEHMRFAQMVWGWSEKNDYWIWVYFRYLGRVARARELLQPGDELVRAMEQEVRKSPADFNAARRCAVATAAWQANRPPGLPPAPGPRGKCDWMGDVCRPPNASDYLVLAKAILASNSPEGASRILRAGLTAPLTQADAGYARNIRVQSSVIHTASDEQIIRGQVRSELVRVLQLAGHADEAAEMTKAQGRMPGGREAGKLDFGKPNPTFERAILEAAEKRGDQPEYWMDRADYYAARGDHGSAEVAYKRAMELAKPEGTRGGMTKSWVLARYISFIAYDRRDTKAGYEKLWAEAKDYPSEAITRLLQGFDPLRNNPDITLGGDSRLWKWLADSPTWTITHMRVIEAMLEKRGNWPLEQVMTMSAGMARDHDTTRAAALADAMMMVGAEQARLGNDGNARKLYTRTVEVLEEALPRSIDRPTGDSYSRKSYLRHKLFEAYEELQQWDKMLALYPEADAATAEYPGRQLAIVAARAGDKALAIRHWERSLTTRPDKPSVQALAQAGCRGELVASARRMLEKSPENEGAKDILKWLGE